MVLDKSENSLNVSCCQWKTSNFEILNLMFEICLMDGAVTWITCLENLQEENVKIRNCQMRICIEFEKSSKFKYANPSLVYTNKC